MQLLPTDFALPALPYLLGLLVAGVATALLLYRRRPAVTEDTVTALAPWMAGGGSLYAIYQIGAVPPGVAPLFSSPAVYLT
ncbi:MAG: putative membrane protein, partial [Natronomonas sp.]